MTNYLLLLGVLASLATFASGGIIWTIAIGHEWGGHEYIDDKGYLQGFGIGFIDLVCAAGNMDCRVIRDNYENCWTHNQPGERPSGGVGLMSCWYDGCIGWFPTFDRIHTMEFSLPYLKSKDAFFYVLKGKEQGFDPSNVTGKSIGFLKGWAANERCLARQSDVQGNVLKPEQIKILDFPKDMLDAMKSGVVHAAFSTDNWYTTDQLKDISRVSSKKFQCFINGNSLMARKGNEIISTWNIAFSKLQQGGAFKDYCTAANDKHGSVGVVRCIDS